MQNSDLQDSAVTDGDTAHRDLALMRNAVEGYVQMSIQRGSNPLPIDAWIPEFYSRHNLTQEHVTPGAILQCFGYHLSELTDWEYSDDDAEMSPWHLQRWTVLHSRVMILARLDLIGRAWAAYAFPVPGISHESETHLWRAEGAKLDPKLAAALFDVPWLSYRL